MNIAKIISDFRGAINFSNNDEVILFRELAKAIAKNSISVFIDEIHGGKTSTVGFTNVKGNQDSCEIADLLLLTHRSGEFRVTFWQAKKSKKSNWSLVSGKPVHIDFDGQLNQWDLLSRRPVIAPTKNIKFSPPSGILSSFTSPSIGSFGVFYENIGNVEVAHSTAKFIACDNPNKKSGKAKLIINGSLSEYHINLGEVIVKCELIEFLNALSKFQIGALLDPTKIEHQWILSYVETIVGTNQNIKNIFSAALNLERMDNQAVALPGGLSILVIDLTNIDAS